MDDPNGNFSGVADIDVNRQEDEDLEERMRRDEEINDLLSAGIHALNYDESTINSSSTSCDAPEPSQSLRKDPLNFKYDDPTKNLTNNLSTMLGPTLGECYKNTDVDDQLKLLYEVRVREINDLREEFKKYKKEKANEINILKNKATLFEAEVRHLQLSSKNLESLLSEKTEIINDLQKNLNVKDLEMINLKQHIDELKTEICAYTSIINELQLKETIGNSLGKEAKNFNSEQLQKAHEVQVTKLESLLQEQAKKVQILENENKNLKEELRKLTEAKKESDNENNFTIMELSKKLQSCQQQCKDLFVLGEAIKRESDYFKERVKQAEANQIDLSSDISLKSMDNETLIIHLEKLKRMVSDKEVQINTLQEKLKFYNSDLDELFEYRKMLNDIYNCEIKSCGNIEHAELLVFMQRQLQSYQQAIEDRNQQIINLNTINKELRERIEEMIKKTQTDIQNLSDRYSLPQLESMTTELKNAQETISDLKKQLSVKNNLYKSDKEELISNLEKLQQEKLDLECSLSSQKQDFKKSLSALKRDLEQSEEEVSRLQDLLLQFKKSEYELKQENLQTQFELQQLKLAKLESEQSQSKQESNNLKPKNDQAQHREVSAIGEDQGFIVKIILKLKKEIEKCISFLENTELKKEEMLMHIQNWNSHLSNCIESFKGLSTNSFNNILKETKLDDYIENLTNNKIILEGEKITLKSQIKSLSEELEKVQNENSLLKDKIAVLLKQSESNIIIIRDLNEEISNKKATLKLIEARKDELETELKLTKKQLDELNEENIKMQKAANEVNENFIRRDLTQKLEDVEKSVLEQSQTEKNVLGSELFQKCLQAEIIKAELLLHQRLQEENSKSLQTIEERYNNVIVKRNEEFDKEKEKWRKQEANIRKQFSTVLEECGKKMTELENENLTLTKQLTTIIEECSVYETQVAAAMEKYHKDISEYKKKFELMDRGWKDLLHDCVSNYSNLGIKTQKNIKSLKSKINQSQDEISLIEKVYEEKIKKFKQRK